MDRGTCLFYRFELKRPVLECAAAIDKTFIEWSFQPRFAFNGSFKVTGDNFALCASSVKEISAAGTAPFQIQSLGGCYKATNPLRIQTFNFPQEWISNGQTTGFTLLLENSDFWPEFLDLDHSWVPGVTLEENAHDYQFAKRLFHVLDADLCLGSPLGEYVSFDDPDADRVLRFTRNGPQKLVRPLEEKRLPYRGYGSNPGPCDEFVIDPQTGFSKWAWIVNKPLRECLGE